MESLLSLITVFLTLTNNLFAVAPISTEPKAETVVTNTLVKTNSVKSTDDVPREYKNALKTAETYLQFTAFSKQGLYDQLTSDYGDKYPAEAAQYAIDNLKVDYKEQALKTAKTYLEFTSFSDQGLFEQLTSEYGDKYTEEEAQYAIDHLDD